MSYFIDVQGTLIDDANKEPIDGARDFIQELNVKQVPYVVVTNNTKQSSKSFYNSLLDKGFDIPQERYLDPFMILLDIVKEKEVFCFGPQSFIDEIEAMGYVHTKEGAKAILVTSSHTFAASDYAQMIECVSGGAKLIGMHATSIYAKEGKRYPGVGAILEMLRYATGKEYEIIGKPSVHFYTKAKALLNLQNPKISIEDVVMISDDALGDLCGIKGMGAKTILVLSGKCKTEEEVLHVKKSLDEIQASIKMLKGR